MSKGRDKQILLILPILKGHNFESLFHSEVKLVYVDSLVYFLSIGFHEGKCYTYMLGGIGGDGESVCSCVCGREGCRIKLLS